MAGGLLDRKSSIETEPRTLSFHQLNFAREAALYVLNTKSVEEAMNIFTEGLEPVVNRERQVQEANNGHDQLIVMDDFDEEELCEMASSSSCSNPFLCYFTTTSNTNTTGCRDVVTAPF